MALQTSAGWNAMSRVFEWMAKPLQYSVLRVNTLRISPQEALKKAQDCLDIEATSQSRPSPRACLHPIFKDVLALSAWPDAKPFLEPVPHRRDLPVVVVDPTCANAVLRGAPVFKGGILAISDNVSINSTVRIEVFREGCRKWLGYGVVRNIPQELGKTSDGNENEISYDCVVEMTEGRSIVPPVPRELVENGFAVCQSLPSIVTSHVLNPQPGERILDFGCGTGFMTTHIAALSLNKAEVIAVDYSPTRVDILTNRCRLLGAKVTIVKADVKTFAKEETVGFDRILVHPDHSNIGVRPCIPELVCRGRGVNINIRKYVEIAVSLLKPGGHLVYCTSSVMPLENDAVVRWLLDRKPDLQLEPAEPRLAAVGVKNFLPTPSWIRLTSEEEKLVQRFGPGTPELESDPLNADVPGFFIACFKKLR